MKNAAIFSKPSTDAANRQTMNSERPASIYELMREYAVLNKLPPALESLTPELGNSLSLLHSCLVESGIEREEADGKPCVAAPPTEINSNHLSHFLVGFLPFNSITAKNDINNTLFEIYSFFRWLDKRGIPHGLANLDFNKAVKVLSSDQERCLRLSHLLDDETGRVLEDQLEIMDTVTDIFSVVKIEGEFAYLRGRKYVEPFRLRLPRHILCLLAPKDNLDLVLGDTSEKWVLLEAGQVFPDYEV